MGAALQLLCCTHLNLEPQTCPVHQVLQRQAYPLALGVTELAGKLRCALGADRLASLLNVAQMAPRKPETLRKLGLPEIFAFATLQTVGLMPL